MKKREVKIVGGYIYKGIEKSSGREVMVTLIGGPVPRLSVIDEDRSLFYIEVTNLEKVGDLLEETPGE